MMNVSIKRQADIEKRQLEYSKIISRRIEQVLKERNISKAKFGRLIGMTQAQSHKLIEGNANMTLKTIVRIEEGLDIQIL